MTRVRWYYMKLSRLLGWAGMLGALGIAYALFYFLTTYNSNLQKLNQAKEHHITAVTQPNHIIPQPIKIDRNAELELFVKKFPPADTINLTWQELAELLEKSALSVDKLRYESAPEARAGLLYYSLNLPIKATYPQIRDFLVAVLETQPHVALKQISFKRESSEAQIIEANIDLAVYVSAPP